MLRDAIRNQVRLMILLETGNVSDASINLLIDNETLKIGVAFDGWPFLSKIDTTLDYVDSTQTIALPSDFEHGIKLIDVDFETPLRRVSAEYGFEKLMDDDSKTTRPLTFWIWNDNIYLHKIPSTNDTDRLDLYYYRTIALLSDDVTQPEWNKAFHEILVYGVLGTLYHREEYYDQAAQAVAMRDRMLGDMVRFYKSAWSDVPSLWGDGMRSHTQTDPNLALLDGV